MTRITHTQIEVTKNPLMKVAIEVPQWEAHVILAIWGDDANITGTVVQERKIPDANDEFTRLANKYGPRDEDTPAVARVYGSFGPGLRALAKEFEASVAGSQGVSVADTPEPVVTPEPIGKDTVAPRVLAGFEGSSAPLATEDKMPRVEGVLSDAEVDALDVPALKGNTVKGVAVEDYMNDISDLIGEGEPDPQAA